MQNRTSTLLCLLCVVLVFLCRSSLSVQRYYVPQFKVQCVFSSTNGKCSDSGFNSWIFVGFSVVCNIQSMQMSLLQCITIYLCVDMFIPTILHIFINLLSYY
jgi:hypothetical protein